MHLRCSLLLAFLTVRVTHGDVSVIPGYLRCEYLVNPVGIEEVHPRLSWCLDGRPGHVKRGSRQTAFRILVASSPERLLNNTGDLWDTGRVSSSQNTQIPYAGRALVCRSHAFWKAMVWDESGMASPWSEASQWTMGLLNPEDWEAKWICGPTNVPGLPLFRQTFRVDKPLRRAELAICGLGFYSAELNGSPVDDSVFEPGWTNYRKTCLYRVVDLTGRIVQGDNVLGVLLGNGMYNVTGGRYTKFTGTFGPPKLIAQLELEYADGTTSRVLTDSSWKTIAGPILFSCIYGGEDYDARKEVVGWAESGLDVSKWYAAIECNGPGGRLSSRASVPLEVKETLPVVSVSQLAPGSFVYDLGQNFSGWPRLTVSGPAGATLKLIPGELLDSNGRVSQRSSGGPVYFQYTLKGKGQETWEPRFSYSGFRYVQVETAQPPDSSNETKAPQLTKLEGRFVYPTTSVDGEFACSNPEVNRVHALILAAIKSNFKSVLTDCPHREKLGWLECSHLLAGCFMYNYDCARFYAKLAQDMREAQLDNGLVPDIAPEYVVFSGGFRDSPEWGSACVIAPWRAYQMYGDERILRAQYDTMKRYVEYLGSRANGHIISHGLGDWYDIGPREPGESQLTSSGVTATGIYYQDLEILRQVAQLLGENADLRFYTDLSNEIRKSFLSSFYKPEVNHYDRGSQTANALPLVLGLTTTNHPTVLNTLISNIREGGNRVTAGDIGFHYVVQALLQGGRSDVLYDMLCQTNGPGYLYQLRRGATSLTEAWDTNPGSSQNHCMLGHIEEWFYAGLLGIRAAAPGFERILISPQPVGSLTWARGHYDSVHGRIASAWKRDGKKFQLDLGVPANTEAVVYLPAKSAASVLESERPVKRVRGVRFVGTGHATAVYEVGAGEYHFESAL